MRPTSPFFVWFYVGLDQTVFQTLWRYLNFWIDPHRFCPKLCDRFVWISTPASGRNHVMTLGLDESSFSRRIYKNKTQLDWREAGGKGGSNCLCSNTGGQGVKIILLKALGMASSGGEAHYEECVVATGRTPSPRIPVTAVTVVTFTPHPHPSCDCLSG